MRLFVRRLCGRLIRHLLPRLNFSSTPLVREAADYVRLPCRFLRGADHSRRKNHPQQLASPRLNFRCLPPRLVNREGDLLDELWFAQGAKVDLDHFPRTPPRAVCFSWVEWRLPSFCCA